MLNFGNAVRVAVAILAAMFAESDVHGEFVHPGVAHSGEHIAFVKAKIDSGEQPWLKAWESLRKSRHASLDWEPKPFPHVERGPYNNPRSSNNLSTLMYVMQPSPATNEE